MFKKKDPPPFVPLFEFVLEFDNNVKILQNRKEISLDELVDLSLEDNWSEFRQDLVKTFLTQGNGNFTINGVEYTIKSSLSVSEDPEFGDFI